MSESLAIGMIWVGALVALIAPVGSWIALVRLPAERRAAGDDLSRHRAAMLVVLRRALLFSAIATAGLCLLVLGGVLGLGWPGWSPALPGGLLIGIGSLGAYDGWLLNRERRSQRAS